MDLLQRQMALEEEATTAGTQKAIKQFTDAISAGRITNTGYGKRLIAAAYTDALALLDSELSSRGFRGVGGKYRAYLRSLDKESIVIIGLRCILNAIAAKDDVTAADLLRNLGRHLETEYMVQMLTIASPQYAYVLKKELEDHGTQDFGHMQRKYRVGAKNLQMEWVSWTHQETIGVASVVLRCFLKLGLFTWEKVGMNKGFLYVVRSTQEFKDHLEDAIELVGSLHPHITFPPCLIPPREWTSYNNGGYYTDEMQAHACLMSMRDVPKQYRKWVMQNLREGKAQIAKDAANVAQTTAYRINKKVLDILAKGMTYPEGVLGLPAHNGTHKPDFPLPSYFDKKTATPSELELFKKWKLEMSDWYTKENTRSGQKLGLALKIKEMRKYQDESELYFPIFFDWRGRMYFRSSINPQSHDAIKACLDFANPRPLGTRGLYWLKVEVANCCGYDKKHPDLRVKWVDENLDSIMHFVNNPFDVPAPEPKTAFCLLRAGLALQEALACKDSSAYMNHCPIAQDATCSGLQHYSAMFLDEIGGKYTNLTYDGNDEKHDIYRAVSDTAKEMLPFQVRNENELLYWKDKEISRGMAKRPVMTYVYSATLRSCMEYIREAMISDTDKYPETEHGATKYLAIPVAKAIRKAVPAIVPKAEEGMNYLKALVRASDQPLRWINMAGIPVVSWANKVSKDRFALSAIGVQKLIIRGNTTEYYKRKAANGISPNWTHSLDSAHLCRTLVAFQDDIIPIHDSFACHACDVDRMHKVLRKKFIEMYKEDIWESLGTLNTFNKEIPRPKCGKLHLEDVMESPYMFT